MPATTSPALAETRHPGNTGTGVLGLVALYDASAVESLCCAGDRAAITFATSGGLVRVLVPVESFVSRCRAERDTNGRILPVRRESGDAAVALPRPAPAPATVDSICLPAATDEPTSGGASDPQPMRDRCLAIAVRFLAANDGRSIFAWAASEGVHKGLLTRAVRWARQHPGRPWVAKSRGGNAACDVDRIEEYRAAWRRYIAEPEVSIAELAGGSGSTHQSLSSWFRRFRNEPGAPVLKPNGRL